MDQNYNTLICLVIFLQQHKISSCNLATAMRELNNLKISVNSLMNETQRISQFLLSKQTNLIFFRNMLEADVDHISYCSHYASIKEYADTLALDADTKIIKEKIAALPPISKKDFEYWVSFPTIVLFLVLPLGIIIWIRNYFHVSALSDKLRVIERLLGTIDFMLKALTN